MTNLKIKTYSETLSDGSKLFDTVIANNTGDQISFQAISAKDAALVEEKLRMLIEDHILDTVEISS